MAGRKKVFDEESVLQCAAELFMDKGYETTSTEDLLAAMNLRKGSLYNTFGSKRALFIRVMQYYADRYVDRFANSIDRSDDPIAAIKNAFLDIARNGTPTSFRRGCFLGNTIMEQASLDEELQKIAADLLKKLEQLYCKHIRQAQRSKKLISSADPRELARHLTTLWNGINITGRMYNSSKELIPVLNLNLAILS